MQARKIPRQTIELPKAVTQELVCLDGGLEERMLLRLRRAVFMLDPETQAEGAVLQGMDVRLSSSDTAISFYLGMASNTRAFRNKNRRIKLGEIGSPSEASAASKADGFEGVRRKDFWRSWTSSSGVSSWPQIHNGHGKALLSTTRVLTADCTLEVMRLNHTAVRLQTFRVRGSHHTEDCQGGKRKSHCLEALGLCRPLFESQSSRSQS